MDYKEFVDLIMGAKEEIYKQLTHKEPTIYFMNETMYCHLLIHNQLNWFCKNHLYNFGVEQLCLVQSKKIFKIYSDGSLELIETLK